MIGPIYLDMKQTGKRSAGKPHAAFDVAGVGNVTMVAGLRAIAKAVESPPAPEGARASSRPYLRGQWRRNAPLLPDVGVDAASGLVHSVVGTAAKSRTCRRPMPCCMATRSMRLATRATRAWTSARRCKARP
ncbi:hypothetical protein CBM2609_U10020 [Cupriavidus taiwanensis]|nr:hypothetical protein CBM2604_U10076 [Cupriavidus taiwanensis]SOZ34424.1 hypothetical protein CBM2609_U10020 [Cupriavidus taiwanensis]SOZ53065.1 hypothetical protein CBM2610_U10074 [Cupriavidus taiwanensis]